MPEGLAQTPGKGRLSRVAERRVAQVVAHGNGLRQILVQAQGPGDGPRDAADLQGVGHPGAVMVPLRAEKDLGLVHQAAKGFAVDDPVNVPLIAGPDIVRARFLRSGSSGAFVRKGGKRVEPSVLLKFQFLPNRHRDASFLS